MVRKYLQAAKLELSNGFVYRANFIMWRVRMVIQLLAVYILWQAIFRQNQQPFGYDFGILMTYLVGSSLLRSLVLSNKSLEAQTEIATGDLSNYLLKPINYFAYWFSRDISDKLLNGIFSVLEITLFMVIIKPPLFIQTNPVQLISFLLSGLIAVILYFFLSFIISLSTFWYSEARGWPQRFLFYTILEFMSGSLFPLDILPDWAYRFLMALPTSYLIFTPMQIYLGQLTGSELINTLAVSVIWAVIVSGLTYFLWKKGIKHYQAFGR